MKEKTIRNKEVIDRFFLAVDMLIEREVIQGLVGFTDDHGLLRSNMIRARNDPTKRFDLYYLWILVNKYDVSADWLFTGKGDVFKSVKIKIPVVWRIARKRGRPKKSH